MPPPTVPTSSPGKRIATCSPPSTRRQVPCAIELVPTIPMSWPVAAKIAAIADAGVNATDCMPDATAPCVPAQASASRSSAVVRSTRRIASSVSVVSAITVFPCPDWKYSYDGFLSPPMFASSIARSIATGAFGSTYAMFSAYAFRVIMFGPTASPVVNRQRTWHIGPTTCVFASRRTA